MTDEIASSGSEQCAICYCYEEWGGSADDCPIHGGGRDE